MAFVALAMVLAAAVTGGLVLQDSARWGWKLSDQLQVANFAQLLLPDFSLIAFSSAIEPLRIANRLAELLRQALGDHARVDVEARACRETGPQPAAAAP